MENENTPKFLLYSVISQKPVVSSRVSSWLKKVFDKAVININILKAHSTRSISISTRELGKGV